MTVIIAIPTVSFERYSSLKKEIESINSNTYKNIHIVVIVNGNAELFEAIKLRNYAFQWNNISVIFNEKRKDWVFSQNRILKEFDFEYYVYACDDFIFPVNCIRSAVEKIQECFPDGFGVISIWKQKNAIIGLFGRKWADHFPNRQVFYPGYIHYCADAECSQSARRLRKLASISKENRITHLKSMDETRRFSQKARNRDHKLYIQRNEKGYKWGVDFNHTKEDELRTL